MVKILDELDLCEEDRTKVHVWLYEWINHIEEQIGVENTARPRVVDFKNWKFFYFTNCQDIINEDPKFEKEITEVEMNRRKSTIFLELFIKYLINPNDVNPKLECNHCGGENCTMESLHDDEHGKMGHIDICPECGRTQIVTYPGNYDHVIPLVKRVANDIGLLNTTNEYNIEKLDKKTLKSFLETAKKVKEKVEIENGNSQ